MHKKLRFLCMRMAGYRFLAIELFQDSFCAAAYRIGLWRFAKHYLGLRASYISPVPGFECDTLWIIFWERQLKAVVGCVFGEPLIGR